MFNMAACMHQRVLEVKVIRNQSQFEIVGEFERGRLIPRHAKNKLKVL
jgi:hypothetical protein